MTNQTALLHVIESTGASVDTILTHTYTDDRERFVAWLAETLLYAFREAALDAVEGPVRYRANWRVIVRCYGQAREYCGRLGGFPGTILADAVRELQGMCADRVCA